MAVAGFLLTLGPVLLARPVRRSPGKLATAAYFTALGLGYLLLEMALLSRVAFLVGDPVTAAAVVLIVAAVVILPTTIHNWRASGTPVLVSANLGANLVTGNRDRADGVSAIPVGVEWDDLQLRARQAGARAGAVCRSRPSGRTG